MNFNIFPSNSDNAVLKCMGSRNKMGRFQNAGDSDLCGGAVLIGDALTRVDYPPISRKVTERPSYPVTLLWYPDQPRETLPRQRARSINTVTTKELLEPNSDNIELYRAIQASRTPQALIETSEASEATPVPARPTAVANTAHKR
jgi:hypothetical protein